MALLVGDWRLWRTEHNYVLLVLTGSRVSDGDTGARMLGSSAQLRPAKTATRKELQFQTGDNLLWHLQERPLVNPARAIASDLDCHFAKTMANLFLFIKGRSLSLGAHHGKYLLRPNPHSWLELYSQKVKIFTNRSKYSALWKVFIHSLHWSVSLSCSRESERRNCQVCLLSVLLRRKRFRPSLVRTKRHLRKPRNQDFQQCFPWGWGPSPGRKKESKKPLRLH